MDILLSTPEIRIIGSLMEKAMTTPDYYPLTLNALTAACNQKTNREPVMNISEGDVEEIVYQLQLKKLVRKEMPANSRTPRYRELFSEKYSFDEMEMATLCVLFLRGSQTIGEIRLHTERMAEFPDLESVEKTLAGLAEKGFTVKLEREPGQKERRFTHCFLLISGDNAVHNEDNDIGRLLERIDRLEERVSELEKRLRDDE